MESISRLGKIFLFSSLSVNPASYAVSPEREYNLSLPPNAEFKNAWSDNPPSYVFMTWCLFKHRENFVSVTYFPSLREHVVNLWNHNTA
jgi:hypothetical protein